MKIGEGLLSRPVWEILSRPMEKHAGKLIDAAARTIETNPDIESKEIETAIMAALNSERAALQDLLRDGKISEDTFAKLVQEVDSALTDNQADLINQLKNQSFHNVEDLITIMLQEKDQSKISDLLESAGYPSTHIASTGGFLGRKNATLLVGIPAGGLGEIKSILEKAPLSSFSIESEEQSKASDQLGKSATIFSLAIERYEEL